jgi:hypothetical protein
MPRLVTLSEARLAKEEVKRMLAGNPGVVGVGVTQGKGGYAVKVNLRHSDVGPVPDVVDRVPVVKDVVGTVRSR